mmetsp:Transcript_14645/g.33675  ORF Transcript_14645/g.33675 Transcript_14645/m.33675 type:complete len:229 (-) Transcript_14645:53-739(-)
MVVEEEDQSATDDVPMEEDPSEDASSTPAGEDDGDEDRSTIADEPDDDNDNESKANSAADNDEETKSVGTPSEDNAAVDEEEEETKSVGTAANDNEIETASTDMIPASPDSAVPSSSEAATAAAHPKKKRGKPQIPASARKGRAPAVKGLNIPFRTVKKAMKLDPDIPIVQNEAAIMTTLAAELFLKRLANQSQKICKNRGKNTIRYEDVADARANDPSLAFLKTIIP